MGCRKAAPERSSKIACGGVVLQILRCYLIQNMVEAIDAQ